MEQTQKKIKRKEQFESPDNPMQDLQLIYEYPEPENCIVSAGSTQVLDDFQEFTDYLAPSYRRSGQ